MADNETRKHLLVDVVVAQRVGALSLIMDNTSPALQKQLSDLFKWYREAVNVVESFDKVVAKLYENKDEQVDNKVNRLLKTEVELPAIGPFSQKQLFPVQKGISQPSIKQMEVLIKLGMLEDLETANKDLEDKLWDIAQGG